MNPIKINDFWYAVDKNEKIFRDMNNEKLKFFDEESCVNWCHTRNELDDLCFITGKTK